MVANAFQMSMGWLWLIFFVLIATLISIDLFLFGGGKSHHVSKKESLAWTLVWFLMAMGFNFLFWFYLTKTHGTAVANTKSMEFFTGYVIEKSLSLDNIFVIAAIFNYFAIPKEYQRRVLIYGVIGAIVMRFIFISVGLILISRFQWILYLLGAFLLYTGIKIFLFAEHKPDFSNHPVIIWIRNHFPVTKELYAEKFIIRQHKKNYVTPLFLVLVLIEMTDIIFAMDSIPAIFAITNDPFIVFTSNIFAILGLRALYFVFLDLNEQFHYLKYGLACILAFIGFKMLIHAWVSIPILTNLFVIVVILSMSILMSVLRKNASHDA